MWLFKRRLHARRAARACMPKSLSRHCGDAACGQNIQRFLRVFLLRIGGGRHVVDHIMRFAFDDARAFRGTTPCTALMKIRSMRGHVVETEEIRIVGALTEPPRVHILVCLDVRDAVDVAERLKFIPRRTNDMLGLWDTRRLRYAWTVQLAALFQRGNAPHDEYYKLTIVGEGPAHVVVAAREQVIKLAKGSGCVLARVNLSTWWSQHLDALPLPPKCRAKWRAHEPPSDWRFVTKLPSQLAPPTAVAVDEKADDDDDLVAVEGNKDRELFVVCNADDEDLLVVTDGVRVVAYALRGTFRLTGTPVVASSSHLLSLAKGGRVTFSLDEYASVIFAQSAVFVALPRATPDQPTPEWRVETQVLPLERVTLHQRDVGLSLLLLDNEFLVRYDVSTHAVHVQHCLTAARVAEHKLTRPRRLILTEWETYHCLSYTHVVALSAPGQKHEHAELFAVSVLRESTIYVLGLRRAREEEDEGMDVAFLYLVAELEIPAVQRRMEVATEGMVLQGELLLVFFQGMLFVFNLFNGESAPIHIKQLRTLHSARTVCTNYGVYSNVLPNRISMVTEGIYAIA